MRDREAGRPTSGRAIGRWFAKLASRTGLPTAAIVATAAAIATVGLAGAGFTKTLDDVMEGDGVVVVTGGLAAIIAITKLLVARSRPPIRLQLVSAHGAAFPSGHSAESIAFYGVLAWIVVQLAASRAVRASACAAAGVIALTVGFSRVYLGVHWTSDVVSG